MGSLHENIQELLDENGVMLVTMCKDLGFSTNILTELRTGRKKDITAGKAKKIAEYFNVSVDRVLYGKDIKTKNPATESGDGKNPTVAESPKWKEYQQLSSQLTEQELSFVISQLKGILHNREDQDGQ